MSDEKWTIRRLSDNKFRGSMTNIYVRFLSEKNHILCVGRDGVIRVFDASNGELVEVIRAPFPSISVAAIATEDQRTLAIAAEQQIACLDLLDANRIRTFHAPEWIEDMAWSSCGRRCHVAMGSDRGLFATLELDSSEQFEIWDTDRSPIVAIVPSEQASTLVTVHRDGVLAGWDTDSGDLVFEGTIDEQPSCVANLRPGQLIVGDVRGRLHRIQIHRDTAEVVESYQAHDGLVREMCVSAGGDRLLSAGGDKRLVSIRCKLEQMETTSQVDLLGPPRSIDISHCGQQVAVVGEHSFVELRNASDLTSDNPLQGHGQPVGLIAYDRNARCIVSVSRDTACWWREDGSILAAYDIKDKDGIQPRFAAKFGSLDFMDTTGIVYRLTCSSSGEIQTTQSLVPVPGGRFRCRSAELHRFDDGRTLALINSSQLWLFPENLSDSPTLIHEQKELHTLTASSNTVFVIDSDCEVLTIDSSTLVVRRELEPLGFEPLRIAVSDDCEMLAAVTMDGAAVVLKRLGREWQTVFESYDHEFLSVSVHGQSVAFGDSEGCVWVLARKGRIEQSIQVGEIGEDVNSLYMGDESCLLVGSSRGSVYVIQQSCE
jgi:WD40 repeat protein